MFSSCCAPSNFNCCTQAWPGCSFIQLDLYFQIFFCYNNLAGPELQTSSCVDWEKYIVTVSSVCYEQTFNTCKLKITVRALGQQTASVGTRVPCVRFICTSSHTSMAWLAQEGRPFFLPAFIKLLCDDCQNSSVNFP